MYLLFLLILSSPPNTNSPFSLTYTFTLRLLDSNINSNIAAIRHIIEAFCLLLLSFVPLSSAFSSFTPSVSVGFVSGTFVGFSFVIVGSLTSSSGCCSSGCS